MISRAVPIYDYRCDHCGHAFSAVQSYNDPPLEKCPNCGKKPRRLIVPPAIVFKGSGFYKTDSRRPEKSESGGKADDSKKSESKSDTKPSGQAQGSSGGKSEAAS